MSRIAPLASSGTSGQRSPFFAVFLSVLLLVACFWHKPIITFGFDPQDEKCLPDLHLALMVHHAPKVVRSGDLLFWKPSGALVGFKESFILKLAAGVPGDHLSIHHGVVRINGAQVVQGLPLAGAYQHTEQDFERDEVIPPGKYFLVGLHPDSNDSRYWGYLDAGQIEGFAYKVF
ncbi:MAG: S26 family signal peptidase [Ralstonia sp.]|jgi:conjugal transfer pilin signal peptidase TrbI|nr:MAG: S26 family signal peptidase [Ralstonia sp.]